MRRILKPGAVALMLILPAALVFNFATYTTRVAAAGQRDPFTFKPVAQAPCPSPSPIASASAAPPVINSVDVAQVPPCETPTTVPPTDVPTATATDVPTATPTQIVTATPDCNYPPFCGTTTPTLTPEPEAPTVTPTSTTVPTPTHKPREDEPEPQTTILSIELQVANGKIWGLLNVENPRAGQSVTLGLNVRIPTTQQEGNDGFVPTGQTTTVGFTDDQTSYNFSFDPPESDPDNAEYNVGVEGSEGEVNGTEKKSLPVSFEEPEAPTATTQPQQPTARPAPTQAPAPTAVGPQNPAPTAVGPQAPAPTQAPAAVAGQVLPSTAGNNQLLMMTLALAALVLIATANWLLRSRRRARKG